MGLALAVLFAVEPIVTGLVDGYQRFSLTGIRVALSGGVAESAGAAGGGLPPLWLAALLWTAYAVLLTVAAAVGARRRDVTSPNDAHSKAERRTGDAVKLASSGRSGGAP